MTKLQDRKYTTKKAVEQLRGFIGSFEFSNDISPIESNLVFEIRIDVADDNSPVYYNTCNSTLKLINGNVYFFCETEYDYQNLSTHQHIKRIDFTGFLASFNELIEKYNSVIEKKEKEIENFLSFVDNWKNSL